MSKVLGGSKIDGVFTAEADIAGSVVGNNRRIYALDTQQDYITSDVDGGSGILLAAGNFANPVGGGGGGAVELMTISGQATVVLPNKAWQTLDMDTAGLTVDNGIADASVLGGVITLPAGTYSVTGFTRAYANSNSQFGQYTRIAGISGDIFTRYSGAHGEGSTYGAAGVTSIAPINAKIVLTQETGLNVDLYVTAGSVLLSGASGSPPSGYDSVMIQITKLA